MKHIKLFEDFLNEGKLPIEKLKTLIEKEFGKKPDCSDLAQFVYDNYNKVTGLRKSARNDEGYFPEEIETLVDEYGFEIDEFSDCYGEVSESIINEAKTLTRDEMMNLMRTKYGLDFVKTSEEFDGEEGGIWLGGSDDLLMPNAKDMMFNYYHGGSKYPHGIHKALAKFLADRGWYGQFADPGTVMLWPR